MMNSNGRGRRKTRPRLPEAAGSATQMEAMMDEEAGGSSQNAGQSGDVLPIQPQLVAAVTEQVLQALSNENKTGEKRRKRQQKGSDSKRQRAPSSSGTDSDSNEESSSDSDSSSSSESDSDDYDLLSDPTTSQIDAKLKNKIWQNKYVDFIKLLPKDDLALDKSLRLQSAGNSEFKFVASKPKKSIKSIEQWTSAFLKFLAVYSEKYPKQIPAVIKHGEIVRELASRSFGLAWLTYDKQVRKDIEVRSIPWGQLHYEYWVMATTFRQPQTQFNFRGKPVQQRVQYRNRIPQGFCYAFHKNGKCSHQQCQYKHICFQCRKTHSILHCTWGDKSNPRGANTSHQTKQPAIPTSK